MAPQVTAVFVTVVEVNAHQADKMMPIKDDHMVDQTMAFMVTRPFQQQRRFVVAD
jgi:hypothetical protein